MATKIIHKKSTVAARVPTAGDLEQGEIALNLTDKIIYTKDGSNNIIAIGTTDYNELDNLPTLTSGTVTSVATSGGLTGGTITASGTISIADNGVTAAKLNVTGNGTTSQYLRSDGDGSFTWDTPSESGTTYSAGTNLSLSGTTFNVVSSPTFTTVNATTIDLGNWTITESAGVLYFATGGVNKMKLDASGNLDVVGDVNSNATI